MTPESSMMESEDQAMDVVGTDEYVFCPTKFPVGVTQGQLHLVVAPCAGTTIVRSCQRIGPTEFSHAATGLLRGAMVIQLQQLITIADDGHCHHAIPPRCPRWLRFFSIFRLEALILQRHATTCVSGTRTLNRNVSSILNLRKWWRGGRV